jgi:hypothetical protein
VCGPQCPARLSEHGGRVGCGAVDGEQYCPTGSPCPVLEGRKP